MTEYKVWAFARSAALNLPALEEQLAEVMREADRRGYIIVNSCMEQKYGTEFWRPALFAMLTAVQQGRVNAVMVQSLDRLSHDIATLYRILRFLQNYGAVLITTETNLQWSAQSIQRILQNEKYCGDVLLQKTFTEDVLTGVHKKNTGQLPQYYIENYHEGIVSKQMFREVQTEIARRNSKSAANQRKRRRGRYNSKYALSERLFCGDCGSPYKRVTWNIHGRKQIVWRCVNRIEYGTKFCGSSPSIPEEELHRAILKAVQGLAANFTDEVAAQINGILHNIQTGESTKPNLQEQLEQTQQEFDRLLEMSLDFDEDTPFLDDRLKKLNNKIKSLKKAIEDSAARQEKVSRPEMLLSAKDLQIQEYDDALTARIIEKITVRSRNEIEIRLIGGYEKAMLLL